MNNQIIHSPISPSENLELVILDVGCGTGIVTDYLAKRYPTAKVYGLDLSPVPALHERPPNVQFLRGNILTDQPSSWHASDGSKPFQGKEEETGLFDLIFSRLLVCGLSDWDGYISTAHHLLKPNGYLEIHDVDWTWYRNSSCDPSDIVSNTWPWWREVVSAGQAKGLDWSCGSNAGSRMEKSGFADVKVEKYRWPWGGEWETEAAWKEFGNYVHSALTGMTWHLIPKLMEGREDEEGIERLRGDMVRDFRPEKGKVWWMYVSVGRKGRVGSEE
ncbi:Hypothetical predicted protein [Lecanosticta acicola]|uniref:S-adenosyl-L-methionine-dependent methyltransferase n=1 Tax=Lecanosticta acicola TaxID=111012 RepID=A0AAI8YUC0_9PEZI|nr:Hypothetical predicted protein [Lecanosticta acicola]